MTKPDKKPAKATARTNAKPSKAATVYGSSVTALPVPTDLPAVGRVGVLPDRTISVKGAREHNLKDVDLTIPRDRLVVFTGVSGSGKSSLAFDTIYAEGQRRYVESLSAYARQFLEMMQKPDVDQIDGLSPAISIEQKTTSKNPRSTVATVTEIHDYMRLLWARVGIPYSPATGLPIESQTVQQMVDRVMALPQGTRLMLLAPVVRERKGEYRKEIAEWQQKGFQRLKIDGVLYAIDDAPVLDKKLKHDIEIVVDRIQVKEEHRARLAEGFEQALGVADGVAYVEVVPEAMSAASEDVASGLAKKRDPKAKGKLARSAAGEAAGPDRIVFSSRFACPVSGFTIEEVEPRLFSFNNPAGACPQCSGIGSHRRVDPYKIVPNPDLSLAQGAVAPWNKPDHPEYAEWLRLVAEHYGASFHVPWKDLPEEVHFGIVSGTPTDVRAKRRDDRLPCFHGRQFMGVLHFLNQRYEYSDNSTWGNAIKADIDRFRSDEPCHACWGTRLKPQALCVRVDGMNIGEVARKSVRDAGAWFEGLEERLDGNRRQIAVRVLKEIRDRLRFLLDVGLDYLTLARGSGTLSGGESQRIRLASQIGSGLTGVLYVLDEPSIGLHQRDNERLLKTLRHLRDLGNSVIVVEHDEDAIMSADYVVDVGPGAGVNGGRIVSQGTPAHVMADPASLTGRYMSGALSVSEPRARRKRNDARLLTVKGAKGNNLKDVSVSVPLGLMTAVTGVSGGGKSTLVVDTLFKAVARKLSNAIDTPEPHDSIEGMEHLDKVIDIDQSPIGRTPRSNPATYVGAFTPIRDWFAGLPEAKARGYKPGRFSFNVQGGRCEKCKGDGVIKVEMHFLPDVYVTCDVCDGKRFDRETLEVKHKGHSISDVMEMPISDALELFRPVPPIRDKLATLVRVGLGYVKVGQQATTLSGGEAQRVKLAKELTRRSTGRTLYVLDEPTTGLHFHDVAKLLELLHELVDGGNTVVVIEHNLEVVRTADWVVDMGPEGGDRGGQVVAQGTPEAVARSTRSHTGAFLKELLARRQPTMRQAAE